MNFSLADCLFSLPAWISLPCSRQALPEEMWREFGKGVETYLEARSSGTDVQAVRADIVQLHAQLGESLGGVEPLRQFQELSRAVLEGRRSRAPKVRRGKVCEDVLAHGSFGRAGMELAYRIPKEYDPAARNYPLILAIPDAGQEPAAHLRSDWRHLELLEQAILVCPRMPEERTEWDRVMVEGRPGGLSHVLSALRFATERFAVDSDRIYVAGRGKGVPAAIAAGNYSPQRFAGIVGRAGDAGDLGPDNFENLPTYFAGGGARAAAFQEALREQGVDNCRLDPTGQEAQVWAWIEQHPRRTYPQAVRLVVGKPFPTRSYWLKVAPTAPDAWARGSIVRDTNTVRIESHGVSHVTLYLNDALVDLGRSVQLNINGVHRIFEPVRSLSLMLDGFLDGVSDPACIYVSELLVATDHASSEASADSALDKEFELRLAATRNDPEGLWELHSWCIARAGGRQAQKLLHRILLMDPDHEGARVALGYAGEPGFWFRSRAAYDRYRRGQEASVARGRGHVEFEGTWLHPEERSLAGRGWEKDWSTGQWTSRADRRRLAEGWARQDMLWIRPEEVPRLERGLWLADGEWVELDSANRRHSKIRSMWRIPTREVVLHSTADRSVSLNAIEHMGRAIEDLNKVFGLEPRLPLEVALLRDEEQYDRLAFGDPDGRRPATDAGRMHVVHSAYFAESWFVQADGKRAFQGMGVGFWDPLAPHGDAFGLHSARLALGLSYVDAIDPSPKTVKKAIAKGLGETYHEDFQAEKQLPAWLRIGAAVYAERYFFDAHTAEGGNPWWARDWSLENLSQRGGMRPLAQVLAFRFDPADRDASLRLLLEVGALVAFLVDGECAPVAEAHAELKQALVAGRLHANRVEALTAALLQHENQLRGFASP